MLRIFVRCLGLLVLLPVFALAAVAPAPSAPAPASNPMPILGKEYQIIPVAPGTKAVATAPTAPSNKIQVLEFFSYGCPWCFHFEPTLEVWLAKQPADVNFVRVPVTFQQGWDVYARAYYVAKSLDVEKKITPAIFKAIQTDGQDLSSEDALAQFFVSQGVSQKDFDSVFHFSPGIDAQLMQGDNLLHAYSIIQVPTLVIDGKYKTNAAMTGGDNNRLLQVIDYLIAQERQQMKK